MNLDFLIPSASSFAHDIDFVIIIIAILGGFFLIAAELIFFYFIFKFRKSQNPKAMYLSGETHEEKKWIHWPHYVVLLCDIVIVIFAVKVWYNVKQQLPEAEETVRIIGQQWEWKFVHPGLDHKLDTEDDVVTVGELRVKNNKVYHFKLQSDDVLHSFSVPAFRLKQDAVPGRVITGWFKPTKLGAYDFQCAEMCGIGHGIMAARIIVESDEDHQKWLESQVTGSMN